MYKNQKIAVTTFEVASNKGLVRFAAEVNKGEKIRYASFGNDLRKYIKTDLSEVSKQHKMFYNTEEFMSLSSVNLFLILSSGSNCKALPYCKRVKFVLCERQDRFC